MGCFMHFPMQKLHAMFCPGWQMDVGCLSRVAENGMERFVWGGKLMWYVLCGWQKWHGPFCPSMFCSTYLL